MAKVFFDANFFIDLVEERRKVDSKTIQDNSLFLSPFSIGILTYLYKYKIPSEKLKTALKNFNLVEFNSKIVEKALEGPTPDFEDNVQLHSAAEADCDYFLTSDKSLLKLKFFGKAQVLSTL